jgi:signal transduction histidine kinase
VAAYRDTANSTSWYGLLNPLRGTAAERVAECIGTALGAWDNWAPWLLIVPCVVAAATRWCRAPRAEAPFGILLVPYLAWIIPTFLWEQFIDSTVLIRWISICTASVLPLLVGYVLCRDRAWLLDRATQRALTGFLVTALLVVTLMVLVMNLPNLLPAADNAKALVLGACTFAVGTVLYPLTRGVSRTVDRFYYGERAQPYKIVRELAQRMSRTVSPGDAPRLLCETVVRTLHLPGARVEVTVRGEQRVLARLGDTGSRSPAFPLTYEGATIGTLHAAPRLGERELDRQDCAVLSFLANQAGPAIASLRLHEELQASRTQIVLAREEERKRLRHDLHDGLGPALSALRLQVDTAMHTLPEGCEAVRSLRTASQGIVEAIAELRRITDGLGPGELARVGLSEALHQLASRFQGGRLRLAIDLAPDPIPPLPAAVEVAVYRICAEALNNVLRHSGATQASLSLRAGPDGVTVEASDDGSGFPGYHPGAGLGLRSMSERAGELGGTLIATNDASGAVVRAVIPASSFAAQSAPAGAE